MIVQTLKWIGGIDGFLELVDQRRLPGEFVKLQCKGIEQVCDAIKTLAVRGAPAIGVAAAYGLVLGLQKADGEGLEAGQACLEKSCQYLASSRPTAVNLFWALDRVKQKAKSLQDDEGRLAGSEDEPKRRARQNVIFEMGLFYGLLNRSNVIVLHKEQVELPSDIEGILYVPIDDGEGWKHKLSKEISNLAQLLY